MNDSGPSEAYHGFNLALLVIRLLVEVAMLMAYVHISLQLVNTGPWRYPVAAAAFAAIAVIWGTFLSPKARIILPHLAAWALEAVLFVGAGLGIYLTGAQTAAIVLLAVWAVDLLLLEIRVNRPARQQSCR